MNEATCTVSAEQARVVISRYKSLYKLFL